MTSRPPRVLVLRRSVAVITLVIVFGLLAALFGGYVDLRRLHDFDRRQDYRICVGANEQLKKAIDQLTAPVSIPKNATPTQETALQVRNQRNAETRIQMETIYRENVAACVSLLNR